MNALTSSESSVAPGLEESTVARDAQRALRASGYRDLCGLHCRAEEGVVTLEGEVGSFFLKQMAQTVVARIRGVIRINNRLRVE